MSDADKLDAAPYNDPDRLDWREQVDRRLDDGANTMKQLRADLQTNTDTTNEARDAATEARVAASEAKLSIAEIKADTSEVIDLLKSFQGAMKVLTLIGKLAKPLSAIVMLGTAAYSLYVAMKSGGVPPK